MTLADIQRLYEYNSWAKARIMSVVETLTQEEFTKNLGSSHGGIHGTLVHIVGAEHIWLSRWTGLPTSGLPERLGRAGQAGQLSPKLLEPGDYPDVSAVRAKWDEVEQGIRGFVSQLPEEQLSTLVTVKTSQGKEFSNPLWQSMQHLVNHSTYHRGQIVTMLRQLGVKLIGTDLITFYREGH